MSDFPERLKQARKAAGLTQTQLGDRLGRAKASVSQWEKGIAHPNMPLLARVCEVLEVTADFLVSGIERPRLSAQAVRVALAFDRLPEQQRELLLRLIPDVGPIQLPDHNSPPQPAAPKTRQ